jgi:hypothetical protein
MPTLDANSIPVAKTIPPTIDAEFVVQKYEEIYRLNKESKGLSDEGVLEKRAQMTPHFEAIQIEARSKVDSYSSKSAMGRAYNSMKVLPALSRILKSRSITIRRNVSLEVPSWAAKLGTARTRKQDLRPLAYTSATK